jgi:hypothetical protein
LSVAGRRRPTAALGGSSTGLWGLSSFDAFVALTEPFATQPSVKFRDIFDEISVPRPDQGCADRQRLPPRPPAWRRVSPRLVIPGLGETGLQVGNARRETDKPHAA